MEQSYRDNPDSEIRAFGWILTEAPQPRLDSERVRRQAIIDLPCGMDERGTVDFDQSVLLALSAMVASIFGSMLGLGGGVFIVPLFTLWLGVDPKVAIGASAVCVVTNSVVGSRRHLTNGYVNFRLATILQSTTAAGAIVGALIALAVSADFLKGLLGVVLMYAAFTMIRSANRPVPNVPLDAPDPMNLMNAYEDAGATVRYVPKRIDIGLYTSGFAGVLSGMLGIGGGLVQVPVMNLIMGVPMRAAAGTSSFMVGMTSVATAAVFYASGKIDPTVAAPAMVGVLAGSSLGSMLTKRFRVAQLLWLFFVVTVGLGISMILSAFGAGI